MIAEHTFKGYWHLSLGLVFGTTAAYNLMRLCATRKTRNGINLALYTGLAVWEARQVRQHWTES